MFFRIRKDKSILKLDDENRNLILNVIFNEALEFGKKWMKPIDELTRNIYPNLQSKDVEYISEYIGSVRRDIFNNIEEHRNEDIVSIKLEALKHTNLTYPWLSKKNVNRAINQGLYYAWHG